MTIDRTSFETGFIGPAWFLALLACLVLATSCDEGTSATPEDLLSDADDAVDVDADMVADVDDCGGCATSETCCDGACIDTSSDAAHCGGCGMACGDGLACADGTCTCTDASCGDDTCCQATDGPVCTAILEDSDHCGRCGLDCAPDHACLSGVCVCPADEGRVEQCFDGQTCCVDLACAYEDHDAEHCGACGDACGPGELCSDGVCACGEISADDGGIACAPGTICCGDPPSCVPPDDPSCGCGGDVCQPGQSCCELPAGDGTLVPTCVRVESDREHCGSCGTLCAHGERCLGGICTCHIGFADCDADPSTGCETHLGSDVSHCGACGAACAPGEVCFNGTCQVSCQRELTNCAGHCVDLLESRRNCGGCGRECPAGEVCSNGFCVVSCQRELTNCAGQCVDLDSNPRHCGACGRACPDDQVCRNGMCAAFCPGVLEDCDGACVDLQNHPTHCGACRRTCREDEICRGADCVPAPTCQPSELECGGSCVDPMLDPLHCGACEAACGPAEICNAGECEPCATGEVGCDNACVDVTSDPDHCGSCGNACAASEVCSGGMCQMGCAAGELLCGQSCTDPMTSTSHCGGCDNPCPSGAECIAGTCECVSATPDLCGDACVDLTSDDANCGSCQNACTSPKSCQSGACSCPAGKEDCGAGCIDVLSDTTNCGACGQTCAANETCESGSCVCPTGFQVCGGACTDTSTDNLNCGSCGNACGASDVCSGGACVAPFTCGTNFNPPSCGAFPLDVTQCAVPTNAMTTPWTGTVTGSEVFTPTVPWGADEKVTVSGTMVDGSSGAIVDLRLRNDIDVVLRETSNAYYDTPKSTAVAWKGSLASCSQMEDAALALTFGSSASYDLEVKRETLSGSYNTGSLDPANATPIAVDATTGLACQQVCGTVYRRCGDTRQYFSVEIPAGRAANVEAAFRSLSGGSNLHVEALSPAGAAFCEVISNKQATDNVAWGTIYRGRVVNNTQTTQTVLIAPYAWATGGLEFNMAIAVE